MAMVDTNCDNLFSLKTILKNLNEGNPRDFDHLMNCLRESDRLSSQTLVAIARDCENHFIELDERYSATLVHYLLNCRWQAREDFVIEEFSRLFIDWVTVHNCHLPRVIDCLVKCFSPHSVESSGSIAVTVEKRQFDNRIFLKIHSILEKLFTNVPQGVHVFEVSIKQNFPGWRRSTYDLLCYVYNMLHVGKYLPDRMSLFFELFVEKLAKIDVHVTIQDVIQFRNTHKNEEPSDFFNMAVPFECNWHISDKLDLMMFLLLISIRDSCYKESQLDIPAAITTYRQLLTAFDSWVITLNGWCQIQFFMLYICSLRAEFSVGFIDYLWKRVQNNSLGYSTREKAAEYLTDFLARSAFVDIDTVKMSLELLVAWCLSYLNEKNVSRASFQNHRVFYKVCHGIFFLCAFRHNELLESRSGKKWFKKLDIKTLVTSALNPLYFVPLSVSNVFADIMRAYEVVYIHSIINDNIRCRALTNDIEYDGQEFRYPFESYALLRTESVILPLIKPYSEGPTLTASSKSDKDGTDLNHELEDVHINSTSVEDQMLSVSPDPDNILLSVFSKSVDNNTPKDLIIG